MTQTGATKSALEGVFEAPRSPVLLGMILGACILSAYGGCLHYPFLSDDALGIVENPVVRHPGAFGWLAAPPAASGLAWRPLATLLFAAAYAASGLNPVAYHVANILVHLGSALLLQGVVRRVLELPSLGGRATGHASIVGFFSALLWSLHPVQTQSVIWSSQATELLMGFFVLLCLYAFLRSLGDRPRLWTAVAIGAAFLGTMSKESVAPLPVLVLLLDRSFVSGSFAAAWRSRRGLYLGLGASWLLLAVMATGLMSPSVGVGLGGKIPYVLSLEYACKALVVYLGLCLWPSPLIFDRGSAVGISPIHAAAYVILAAGLVVSTVAAYGSRPRFGFLRAWFLFCVAPVCGLVPLPLMPMAENRVHLALAAITVGVVIGAWRFMRPPVAFALCLGLGVLAAAGTVKRAGDYRSALALWTDTVAKQPDNARAHTTLAAILASEPGRTYAAEEHYAAALRLSPGDAMAHFDLGNLLAAQPGREAEAEGEYRQAIRLKPDYSEAHDNLGLLLGRTRGREDEAIAELREALRTDPNRAEPHNNLANLLARIPGREAEAVSEYDLAIKAAPDAYKIYYNLGNVLFRMPTEERRTVEAYQAAVALQPDFVEARFNLGIALNRIGRTAEAIEQFRSILRLRPDLRDAREALEALGAKP